jgi:uncharacterized protein YbcC (UPF0753/DUF2309 family)
MQSTSSASSDARSNSHGATTPVAAERRLTATPAASADEDARAALAHALEEAAEILPDQAPLEMFVHHNTLHALQHHPFHEALRSAHARLGAHVYRDEASFRHDLETGRIRGGELDHELDRYLVQRKLDPDEVIGRVCSRRELYSLALRTDLTPPSSAWLRWRVREERFDRTLAAISTEEAAPLIEAGREYLRSEVLSGDADALARRFLGPHGTFEGMPIRYGIELSAAAIERELSSAPEALVAGAMWQTIRCLARTCAMRSESRGTSSPRTHRASLLARTGVDAWQWVHPELLRWAAAYLDEGFAYWPMPGREAGFFASVRDIIADGAHVEGWLRRAARAFADLRSRGVTAEGAALESLAALGIEPAAMEAEVARLLTATPGFAGMFSRLQRHPHERGAGAPPTSLLEFCAVRLVLERAALEQIAASHDLAELPELDRSPLESDATAHYDANLAYRLFIVAQKVGLSLRDLDALHPADASLVLDTLDEFDELERGRIFLEAYERRYRTEILDGLRRIRPDDPKARVVDPSAQYVACIDDREESLRRHIEEIDPRAETFGAAGSFGLAIDYRGFDQGGHVALGPAGVRPRHEIVEMPRAGESSVALVRRQRRFRWGTLLHQTLFGSRSAVRGVLASFVLGPLAWIPLSLRIVAPRASMRMLDRLRDRFLPKPRTDLANEITGACSARGLAAGFTFDEQVDRVHALLEGMGLRESFAPLVFLLAHGSTSLNNPHEAAHDCGACGGRRGGATARLLAVFANDGAVRKAVAERGIAIPDTTWFVAGEHDTSNDRIDLYDTDRVPAAFAGALADATAVLERARALDGHERARKFEVAALEQNVDAGLRHVEARASHLAEPRPEYGHCTNAMCIVGRRSLTRGLFLDRRAFLVSYDPDHDPTDSVLDRLMAIAGPVGAGINLEYYFSIVDPERFGAGTKLPHNICGYLGVLNGTSGDLRTGLPLQMTEIHEPMRLLVIVEATPQALLDLAGRQPIVAELVTGGWIQLVSLDPDSGQMRVFEDGVFIPYTDEPAPLPEAETSVQYYAKSREFLPPARIVAGLGRAS